jgi:prepilin-type N-terminal cleavage/methylation domain-containing protein
MLTQRHTSSCRRARPAWGRAGWRACGRGGFTLVEILTVVIILGISAAIIIPSVSNRDDMRVASAARLVMADLIFAQNKAIAGQKPCYVRFDSANQRYSIHETAPTAATTIADAIDHPLLPAVFNGKYVTAFGLNHSQLEKLSIGTVDFGGMTCLKYDELGVPYAYNETTQTATQLTGTSIGKIVLTCGKFSLTITVEPYTGETTVN